MTRPFKGILDIGARSSFIYLSELPMPVRDRVKRQIRRRDYTSPTHSQDGKGVDCSHHPQTIQMAVRGITPRRPRSKDN